MKTPAVSACEYCIDGMVPAGTHPTLGLVYQRCPYCTVLGALPPCLDCADIAVFPADFTCLHCMLVALAACGLTAAICPGCAGITYTVAIPPSEGELQ